MIAPAPRKPMPVTICAAIRVGSARTTLAPESRKEWNPYAPTIVKRADPTETSKCVRRPASRSRISRSKPISPPSSAASASRRSDSSQLRVGSALDASCSNGFLLSNSQLFDSCSRELEQLVEPRARERRLLSRGLHLDERAVARHDDVHVHLRLRVLRVVEIEQRVAVDDSDGHRSHRPTQCLREPEPVQRSPRRDIGTRDRGAPSPTVGLQHVAVDPK